MSTLLQRQQEEHCSGLFFVVAHSDNFHKVRHGICRCVEARLNPPYTRGLWHQNNNKCSILSGRPAETGDAAQYSGDFFIFQQDSGPVHRAGETVPLLQREVPAFIAPNLWPPNSPDLNPVAC